jgi:uncharacterized protein DUF4340
MNPRHLKWIAGAIVVLLAIWLGGRALRSPGNSSAGGLRLAAVAADSADTIVVAAPAETITVIRTAGGWTANGFPGSAAAVTELLTALRDSTPAELVSQSTGSFGRLGMDSTMARRVRVSRGAEILLDVLVSDRGPDGQSAYVRLPGDSAVYAQPGQLGTLVRRGLDDWRDKTVAVITPDSVGEVELVRGTRRTVLQRRESSWRHGTGAADTAAVARLLERYRTVTAAGFPSALQLDSTFRGRPERRVTLRDRAGVVLLALEFDSVAGSYWARRPGAGRDGVYRFNSWDADELVPADSTFRFHGSP